MNTQLSLPVEVRPDEIARKQSLGAALELCAELGGYALDKQLSSELGVDKAQFSRWMSNTEGITWCKLRKFMEKCGNHAPVLWMLHQLGYDLGSLRKQKSELERELETVRTALAASEQKAKILADAIAGRA